MRFDLERSPLRTLLALLGVALSGPSPKAAPQTSSSPHFTIQTASSADMAYLPRAFRVLEAARKELKALKLNPPERVTLVVHPTLVAYQKATGAASFEAARADRATGRIEVQRFRVLEERGGLDATLRHELFHLSQPAGWPRWRAEGEAARFSGESVQGPPYEGLSEAQLERLLSDPPSGAVLRRAVATAVQWVSRR